MGLGKINKSTGLTRLINGSGLDRVDVKEVDMSTRLTLYTFKSKIINIENQRL
jgi:hypothetical protein